MLFQSRCFWHPKDREFAAEYEDAFRVGEHGVVAVADGVSSAIFSRQWSNILTQGVIDSPPDLSNDQAFAAWLADRREAWKESIDFSQLGFFQKQKLQEVGGAYSTLLWIELRPPLVEDESAEIELYGRAIGDCCMFIVRDGELACKFPLELAEEFDADPLTICSVNRNRDHLLDFESVEFTCHPGDLIVLASDALAKWAYQRLEAEEDVDWDEFWSMSAEEWQGRVASLRELPHGERMRVDDTTVVMLRLSSSADLIDANLGPSAHQIIGVEAAAPEELEGNQAGAEPLEESTSDEAELSQEREPTVDGELADKTLIGDTQADQGTGTPDEVTDSCDATLSAVDCSQQSSENSSAGSLEKENLACERENSTDSPLGCSDSQYSGENESCEVEAGGDESVGTASDNESDDDKLKRL